MKDIVIFEKHVLDLMSGPDKDILDIGFGWGVTSNYFYNKGVKSLNLKHAFQILLYLSYSISY